MPVGSVNNVVVLRQEVLIVADASVGVGHGQVGGGVHHGQPAEKLVVWGGRVRPGDPVASAVVRVGHHQLAAMEVGAQDKRDGLHPADDRTRLRGNLPEEKSRMELGACNKWLSKCYGLTLKIPNIYKYFRYKCAMVLMCLLHVKHNDI